MLLSELKCIDKDINIEEYLRFYDLIKLNISNKEWLGSFSSKEIKGILNNDGKIWVYYLDDEIVCSMMYIPASEDSLKLFNLSYSFFDVGECGPIMVNPKYVGNGLQKQMLRVLENYCRMRDKKIILTTVHPKNIYSINNFIKLGYKYINSFKFKRGNRDLYIKEII